MKSYGKMIIYLPTAMVVCKGDAPGPPVEAPWLSETDSPTQQKKVEYLSYYVLR